MKAAFIISVLLTAFIQTPQTHRTLVLEGGTIIDVSKFGKSGSDIKDSIVIIKDGQIIAAGPRKAVRIPAGAMVIKVAHKYIVPGLNDAFATQNNQAQANAHLYMGVTSIVGSDEPGGRRGRLYLEANPSPRVYKMDVVTGYDEERLTPPPSSIADLRTRGTALSEAQLVKQVDALVQSGIKVLLLYYSLSPEQVRVVVRHARELNIGTIGELGFTTYYEAIEAGVNAFVHTSRYSLELAPAELRKEVAGAPFGPPRVKYYQFLAGLNANDPAVKRYGSILASGRVGLIPTISLLYLDLPDHKNPWKEPAAAILDPKDIHLPANPLTGNRDAPDQSVQNSFPAGAAENELRIEEQYQHAGAKYLAGSGTDAFGTLPGISLHTELKLLTRVGLTPREAIAAATSNFGDVFGWKSVGQVKAGYNADVLVLDENPLEDIEKLKKIHMVILKGEILDRDKLLLKRLR
jgi:hypothetical protein